MFVARDTESTVLPHADWGSLQDHLDFLADQERQAPFAAQFADARKSVTDNVTMKHVVLPTLAALRCLHAPLTEFVRVHAKPGASLDAVQTVLDKYVAHANNESTLPVAAAYGRGIGDSIEESILVIGWNSLEVGRFPAHYLLGPEPMTMLVCVSRTTS